MSSKPYKPYNETHANEICEMIASSNQSLYNILSTKEEYPKLTTWFKWCDENETLAKNYARAKGLQAHFLAEEILRISDDDSQDLQGVDDYGNRIENKEFVNRSKLRVDARKWVASKLLPKVYGDKMEFEGEVKSSISPELVASIADKINSNASTR